MTDERPRHRYRPRPVRRSRSQQPSAERHADQLRCRGGEFAMIGSAKSPSTSKLRS
jgi:hypothetical protein